MSRGTEAIPDAKLGALLNVIYNVWFRKWKNLPMDKWTELSWSQLIGEANNIWEQGKQYQIVGDLVMSFLYEFEIRWRAWYDAHPEECNEKPEEVH